MPDLAYVYLPAGSANLLDTPISYGRFLDSRWKEVVVTEFRASVQYPVSGGSPVTLYAKAQRADPATELPAAIGPVVGPPASPVVNGKSLFQQEAGVSTTPVISWSAPALGSASSYELELYRLNANSTVTLVLHAFLRNPSFRVPPDILLPSSSYLARITAHAAPWDTPSYVGTYTFIPAYPFAFANCLTSTFTP
jgi:hypothetical protein